MLPHPIRRSSLLLVLSAASLPDMAARAAEPADLAYRVHEGTTEAELVAWSVAGLGDVNGDGVKDYVLGVPGSGTYFQGRARVMSGLTGEMLHSFGGVSIIDFSGWCVANAGDVDADGFDDVIIGLPFSGTNAQGAAWINSGATGMSIREIHGTQSNALTGWSVAGAGDVNGDGHADVIVGTRGGRVEVFSGANGSRLLLWPGGGQLGYSVAGLGDVNDDGHPDLAVGAPKSGFVDVVDIFHRTLIRTINGSVANEFGKAVANAGDTDGDGVNELLIGSHAGAFLYNASTGQKRYSFLDGLGAAVAGAGDVNADGYDDIIIADSWTTSAHTGRAEVRSGVNGALLRFFDGGPTVTEFGASAAGIGDVNGDGYTELLVGAPRAGDQDEGAAYIFLGGPNFMEFEPGGSLLVHNGRPSFVTVANLDKRWDADLVTLDRENDRMSIHVSLGHPSFLNPIFQYAGPDPTSLATVDMDKDGDRDIVVARAGDNRIGFYRSDLGILTGQGLRITGANPSGVVAADFNADGFTDLAVTNSDDDTVSIFMHNRNMSGVLNTRYKAGVIYPAGDGPTHIVSGDFNNDGLTDLAVSDANTHQLAVLRGRGDGRFRLPRLTSVNLDVACMSRGDFDHDGFDDLAWVSSTSDLVHVSRGLGTGKFAPAFSYPVGAGPTAVVVADLDRDGHPDLAVTSSTGAAVSILINNQNGFFTAGDAPPIFSAGPAWLAAGDLDDDDDPDLAIADDVSGTISTLMNLWFDTGQ